MKGTLFCSAAILLVGGDATALQPPKPLVTGLARPESAAVGSDGKVYVTVSGELDTDGDGAVLRIDAGKAVPFATGLDDPCGLAVYQQSMFVADKSRVWRIDVKGKAEVFAAATAFPTPPQLLKDIAVDPESGILYVADAGDRKGNGGAIYRIDSKGKVDMLVDTKKIPGLHSPGGLVMDGASHLLMTDLGTGELRRVKHADRTAETVLERGSPDGGLAWDYFGRLFLSDGKSGRVYVIGRPGDKPVVLAEGFRVAGDIGVDPVNKRVLVPDPEAGTVTAVPIRVPGAEVDETPFPLQTAVAFPELQFTGWIGQTEAGTPNPLRPILLTHAGDGSDRVFVATQHGVIHVFPNDQKATKTTIFLDIQNRVSYRDDQNEEGFLGLAFHPKYKENGEFFVFYTTKKTKLTNIVSRFRVSKDDPSRADPSSEEELLRFDKPFWNHDGGTICFGPDGYLYITHGDGGAANDPYDNGQKLATLLGKVLRIDVDRKEAAVGAGSARPYAIPKDNPFVGRADARPEIWAYGLRNLWRMAFEKKTGQLWAGEVGQNLYEEIIIVTRGGNYGWNRREALHPFGPKGTGPRPEFIEPIWEYHHDVGKSITGGTVYRGPRLPELDGWYLYGDYVSNRLWALKYDETKGRVVANRQIKDRGLPVYSFGEDEKGEVYFLTATITGKGIHWFVK